MRSLLYLPVPISFLVVVSVSVALSLLGLKFARKKLKPERLRENHEVAGFIFNAFGLIYAVLIAFVVYATWSNYDNAKEDLEMEANKLTDLFVDSRGFPEPAKTELQKLILKYADLVVNDEWKRMEEGEKSPAARGALEEIFSLFLNIDIKTFQNPLIYQETFQRLNELSEYRRMRLVDATNNIPSVVWLVVIVGAVISIGYTYFFGTKHETAQFAMTAALTITNSMVLFLIYILDHPYTGTNKIVPDAFHYAIDFINQFMK